MTNDDAVLLNPNHMKKIFLIVSLISIATASCLKKMAQSKMVDPSDKILVLNRNFKPDRIEQLKATTTVFFYNNRTDAQIDSLRKSIASGWNITPVIYDNINNFEKYATDPKYSYFIIEGVTTSVHQGAGSYENTHYYLTLRLFREVTRKDKILTDGLCRIELYPNYKTIVAGRYGRKANDVINDLYNDGVFYNWSPVLMRAQLGAVSTNLKKNNRPWLFKNVVNEDLNELLSKDTLYVPNTLLMEFNAFTGREKKKSENFFSNYGYKYKICSEAELFDIFENQKRGRLLFEYVKSSTDQFVTIYDLKQNSIVYKQYSPMSYNLNSKDVEKIRSSAVRRR